MNQSKTDKKAEVYISPNGLEMYSINLNPRLPIWTQWRIPEPKLYFYLICILPLQGVFEGVTGVVTKPIEGARDEGFGGFVVGMGKGVVGLVTRPASGVIDFASESFDAVVRYVTARRHSNVLEFICYSKAIAFV